MKILYLNYEYPPLGGGAANATAQILQEFVRMDDMEVHLVTSAAGKEAEHFTLGGKVQIHRLPIGKDPNKLHSQSLRDIIVYSAKTLLFSWQLVRREKNFDATLAFFGVPCGFLAYLLKLCFGLPYVVALRGSDVPGYSKKFDHLYFFLTPLVRFVWRKSAAVVANSKGLRDLALTVSPKQPMEIIGNGVDTKHFVSNTSSRPTDQFIVTPGASRVTARKGLKYLVEAIQQLAPRFPQLRLKIMGDSDGNERAMLEELAKEGNISDRVEFIGRVPREETTRYYQEASLFVLPSLNEGMSNAMLEALACGLPIIMTPTGGAEELIEEGKNGMIVPFESSKAVAAAMETFLTNPQKVQSFGAASRVTAEANDWQHVAEHFKKVLSQAKKK